jgi:D-alanyl-D-alanine carboxypeptidase/D-alanyl-D-alanine-endopeptidase (penicillin-binding protein 4)
MTEGEAMNHRWRQGAIAVLGFLLVSVPGWSGSGGEAGAADAAVAPGPDSLQDRLDASLHHRGLRGARIAALVIDRDSGETLYAHDPDDALVPASNMKVFTALAALSALGPTHHFETGIRADAAPDAEGAVQNLYVMGGGDPALTSEDVWRLAADLRREGLRRVRGDIVLDASRFDDQRWHPSWGKVSARAYHAPVSALTVNYGSFAVEVAPGGAPGEPLRVVVDPPVPFLQLVNRGQTLGPKTRAELVVDRRPAADGEQVVVSGGVRVGSAPKAYPRSVLDPVRYAGAVLKMQLEANGVVVDGGIVRGAAPSGSAELLAFEGKSLGEIVRLFVKYSNNTIAESLVKDIGLAEAPDAGPATWSRGLAAMRSELEGLGLEMDRITMVDGSGLSYGNKVPPRVLVHALVVGERSFRFGPEFVAALPIAAADGTLEKRAEGAAYGVRAKTGLLTRVTGLSGFGSRPDGRVAVFSILVNGFRGSAEAAMDGVDGFVSELVAPISVAAHRP